MVRRLGYFLDQFFHTTDFCAVGWDADGLCAVTFVREGIECRTGLVARSAFSRGYVDFGATGLEESNSQILN